MFSPRMTWLGLIAVLILSRNVLPQSKESAIAQRISYRTVKVDGLSIFYREAGPKDGPTILLLHGLPLSSRMFEPLLTRLAVEPVRSQPFSASNSREQGKTQGIYGVPGLLAAVRSKETAIPR